MGHPPPPHPQLLSMKECSGKKVQKVKVAQNDPLESSSQKNWSGGQGDQGGGVVLHVQDEVYQSTLTFKRRVAGYVNIYFFLWGLGLGLDNKCFFLLFLISSFNP